MSYEVLARKWRPQQFQDVVGQEHVIQTLSRAIQNGRVAHAYLFVGPRGTGKTTTARLLAKALNCMKLSKAAEPCNKCDSCREIVAGNSLDVIEIDGASNNSVEQIRELRDNVRYAPARGPFKVYIIDEVHMLSTGAFNALLKTLEEPPPHAKFVLATTDVHKVPATILSRCQRFDLRRIGLKEMVGRLQEIVDAEKWTVTPDALLAIARGAEGGLRDAESALDQLIAFKGEKIEEADVLSVFGLVSWTSLNQLAEAIVKGDAEAVLTAVAELDDNGRDLQRLVQEMLSHFRNLLVWKHAPDLAGSFDLTEAQLEALKQQGGLVDNEKLLRIVEILTDTANQIRFALSRRTLLEIGLLKAVRAASVVSIDELIAQLQQQPGTGEVQVPALAVVKEPAAKPASPAPPARVHKTKSGDMLSTVKERWPQIMEIIGGTAQMAVPYLKDAIPLRIEDDHLVLGFDPEFAEYLKRVDNSRTKNALEKAVTHEAGHALGIRFVLEELPRVDEDVAKRTAKRKKTAAPEAPPPLKGTDLEKDPIVKKTMEIFDADIIDKR